MTSDNPVIRVLMSAGDAERLASEMSRRRFLGVAGGSAALVAFLAACGGSDGGSGGGSADSFNLFTWAEYDDPDLLSKFGKIQITIYDSNEEAVQKLVAAGGNGGFDMICPTGIYIPQLVGEGLLEELDLSRVKNFGNLDAAYTNQPWDPGNKHSVCKNWGSTGWFYDKTIVKREIKTWSDFIDVAQKEASENVSLLDSPPNVCGLYFWANGIDWTTTDAAQLKACEDFLVDDFARHIKAFDSYPGISLTQGNYALSMIWNGDARQGLLSVEEAGGNPDDYVWGLGAPETELWMDNWCILKGAKNIDACYAFLDFILDPANSAIDVAFHGYNTGISAARDALPADTKYLDIVYFTDADVARMRSGSLDNQESIVGIYNKTKAAAGA